MGLVQRQAIKNNLLSYLGLSIGVVSQLFIYHLDLDAKGFADGLIKLAGLIFPFMTLGVGAFLIRFVPYVKGGKPKARSQLFTLSMKLVTIGLLLLTAITFFFGDEILTLLVQRGWSSETLTYRWPLLILIISLTYAAILSGNLINFNRIAIPVVFNDLTLKIGLPLLILLHYQNLIAKDGLVAGLVIIHLLIVTGLLVYSHRMGALKTDFSPLVLESKSKKEMFTMSAYGMFGLLGSSLITNTDVVAINQILTNRETAIFGFSLFAVSVMKIPFRAINTIVLPDIASLWQKKDIEGLKRLYQDASAVLAVGGGLIYVGLIVCLPYFYPINSGTAKYAEGYTVAVFLGTALSFDLITSINSPLISYTDHFRWSFVFILFSGVLNIILNYYFLSYLEWGIEGAAIATMISLFVYNLLKVTFVYWKMKIQPFHSSLWNAIATYAVVGLVAWAIPETNIFWITGIIKGSIIVVGSYLVFRYTEAVPVVKRMFEKGLKSAF